MKNEDIKERIKENLNSGNFSCVISNQEEIIFTSEKRGVAPLVDFINDFNDTKYYYLADRVIGKAAALLCVKANIKFVYTYVISTPARRILEKYGISYGFDAEVPAIQNRNKNGLCPMENLSKNIDTPDEIYTTTVEWLASQ